MYSQIQFQTKIKFDRWIVFDYTIRSLNNKGAKKMQTVNLNGRILKVKPNLSKQQQKLVDDLQKLANNKNKKLN